MKKAISLILAMLTLCSLVVFPAGAAGTEGKQRNCGFCGRLLTGSDITYVKANCTTAAHYVSYCPDCRVSFKFAYEEDTNPALGHIEAVEVSEVSCTNDGYERRYCTRCNGTLSWKTTAKAYGHDYVQLERDPSWAKSECRYKKQCTRCGDVIQGTYASGHADSDKDKKCDRCNFDYVKECGHFCHKDGFLGFIYKIARIFWNIFNTNTHCECGAYHL